MKYRWVIFFSLLGVLFLYTARQVLRLMPLHPLLVCMLTLGLFFLMFGWQFLARFGTSRLDSRAFRMLTWIGSISLGAWATFIVLWMPIDVIHGAMSLIRAFMDRDDSSVHIAGGSPSIGMGSALFVFSMALAGLGLEEALTGPLVKKVTVPFPQLSDDLDGLTIAMISDFHIGPMIREGYVERVVQKILTLEPDLIAFTGDLADGTVDVLDKQVQPLAKLKAPLGNYYITGNHEYYWGVQEWIEKARSLGFVPLVNQNRLVRVGKSTLMVAGVTDLTAHHFVPEHRSDPKKAAASTKQISFKLLLAHRPTSCLEAEPLGFDLQLSGHTHGGQFFPFNLLIPLFYRYYRGLYRHGNMWLYVNPGTGYWGPPHRFLVPAEITLLRLAKSR